MSYSIYYDRAFIRAADKFIPLANSGSNNCWEFAGRRQVPEKNWNVLNWKHESQILFTESEISDIARVYDTYNQESGMLFKSRNRCFEAGEFERWMINGMKNAYTVEEYVSFGNSFFILDYAAKDMNDWKRHPFKTTVDMLNILDDLKGIRNIEVKLFDNREVYRPIVKRSPNKPLNTANLSEYYILKGKIDGHAAFFIKLTRKGSFRYATPYINGRVKPFKAEKDALTYLKKYQHILGPYAFAPEKIITGNANAV